MSESATADATRRAPPDNKAAAARHAATSVGTPNGLGAGADATSTSDSAASLSIVP